MNALPDWAILAGVILIVGVVWQTVAAIYWSLTAKQAQQDAERWEGEVAKLLTNTEAFRDAVARGALEKMGTPLPTQTATEAIQFMKAALTRVVQLYAGAEASSGVASQMYVVARSALDQVGVALYARPTPPQTTVESAGPSKAPPDETSGSTRRVNAP